jgi:nitrous oxidase accessory protein
MGKSDVITVNAEGVTIRGFEVINSSVAVSTEPGGIRLSADGALIENNRLREVLYGIIMVGSRDHVIRGNDVRSIADQPTQRRGHAIYLYGSGGNLIEDNIVRTAKDGIFLGFANDNLVRNNHVSDVRYGIHYMYADDNIFEGNTFIDSVAGAAIMYSTRIELSGNVFANNRSAASGYGILLKDVNDVTIKNNLIHHNRLGLTLEGAPQTPGSFVRFEDNLIGYNQVAIEATSTTRAVFVGNSFIGNLQLVEERSGDIANLNTWAENGRGNYWDTYQGYDANGDGIGDIPFEYSGTYEALIERNAALKAYQYSFAQVALDMTARWFPVYRYEPRVSDPAPLLRPTVTLSRERTGAAVAQSAGIAAAMVLVPLAGFWFARSTFRRGWAPC